MRQKTLQANIWKYGVHLITNKRSYLSILGVYLLTLPGTTPQTVGLMLLAGNIAGFLFEIPSGYFTDMVGHKTALVVGRVALLASSLAFLVGGEGFMFILGAVLMSIGMAFQSGTGAAFMHETLRALGRENEYSKIMGRLKSLGFAVPIALIMLVPFLVGISFKLPFVIAVVIDCIGLLVVASYAIPPVGPSRIQEIGVRTFWRTLREGWDKGFLRYALFVGILAGTITAVSGFKDVYQAFLGVPIIYFGVFWGLSRVLVSFFLLFNQTIKRFFTFHQFLFFRLLSAVALILALGIVSVPYVIVALFIFIAAFNWSTESVKEHYLLEIIGNSSSKATLLSVCSQISFFATALVAYLVGALAASFGYAAGFVVAAGLLFLALLPLYLFIVVNKVSRRS